MISGEGGSVRGPSTAKTGENRDLEYAALPFDVGPIFSVARPWNGNMVD
jgi:hypothetical protein